MIPGAQTASLLLRALTGNKLATVHCDNTPTEATWSNSTSTGDLVVLPEDRRKWVLGKHRSFLHRLPAPPTSGLARLWLDVLSSACSSSDLLSQALQPECLNL